jgi:hypothetical protein
MRRPAAISASRSSVPNSDRIIVGTTPMKVMPCSCSTSTKVRGSKRPTVSTLPPCISVISATQIPKLKVSFSTSSVVVSAPACRSRWFCSNLPWNAAWDSTAPFGVPVDPDVKITSAPPSSMLRRAARDASSGSPAGACGTISPPGPASRSTAIGQRAFDWITRTTSPGAERWIGAASAPAIHTPRNATKSVGWFEQLTSTGSCATGPAATSRFASAAAASHNAPYESATPSPVSAVRAAWRSQADRSALTRRGSCMPMVAWIRGSSRRRWAGPHAG